jgi:hypothetical protein
VVAGRAIVTHERLILAGQWRDGDRDILIVLDAGYDLPRIAHLLADLLVEILGRMSSDRDLRKPVPSRVPGTNGRPAKHGGEFVFGDAATWGVEQAVTSTDTRLYGTAIVRAWDRPPGTTTGHRRHRYPAADRPAVVTRNRSGYGGPQ